MLTTDSGQRTHQKLTSDTLFRPIRFARYCDSCSNRQFLLMSARITRLEWSAGCGNLKKEPMLLMEQPCFNSVLARWSAILTYPQLKIAPYVSGGASSKPPCRRRRQLAIKVCLLCLMKGLRPIVCHCMGVEPRLCQFRCE